MLLKNHLNGNHFGSLIERGGCIAVLVDNEWCKKDQDNQISRANNTEDCYNLRIKTFLLTMKFYYYYCVSTMLQFLLANIFAVFKFFWDFDF